jgi:hypothetical protein
MTSDVTGSIAWRLRDGLRVRGAELVREPEGYEDSYRPCYVHGLDGIIIELAERISQRVEVA